MSAATFKKARATLTSTPVICRGMAQPAVADAVVEVDVERDDSARDGQERKRTSRILGRMSGFDPARAVNVEDLRELARRRLPRMVFDYIDGGADAEITLRGNCRVFDDITFRPRAAVSTATVDLRTTVAGTSIALPFLLAPIGSSRMFYPRGEVAAARAAGRAGTAYILSTLSGCALEDVRAACGGPVWYQV